MGDSASIDMGGKVEVVGVTYKEETFQRKIPKTFLRWTYKIETREEQIREYFALCSYKAKEQAYGACAPTGSLFFIPVTELLEFDARFATIETENKNRRNLINTLKL